VGGEMPTVVLHPRQLQSGSDPACGRSGERKGVGWAEEFGLPERKQLLEIAV